MIGVVDVTDKQHPKTISLASYPNVGFAHQGWLTNDQRYFFLDDELDEVPGGVNGVFAGQGASKPMRTIVFDMKDLGDPTVFTEYFAPFVGVDHNLYIRGRYMYQGDNERGLRIIDVADPKNPKEVGYLTNVGAAWGTYPFLKDDVVAVSTLKGLFLARLQKQ
jgi:choice-of-anchor B domain-containing protein